MKRTMAILLVLMVSAVGVIGVFAQDDETPEETPEATTDTTPYGRGFGPGPGAIFTIVMDALDVDEDTLRTALLEDGATWASVIESLGGDVDEIHALIVAEMTANLEARLAEVDGNVTEMLNSTLPPRGMGRDGGMGPRDGGFGRGGRGPRGGWNDNATTPDSTEEAPATEDEANFGSSVASS